MVQCGKVVVLCVAKVVSRTVVFSWSEGAPLFLEDSLRNVAAPKPENWSESGGLTALGCDQFGLGLRRGLSAGWGNVLPLTEGTAEESGRAALTAENDDVRADGHVPVPGHEADAVRRNLCQNPVVTGLLLDSTYACEQLCGCHCLSCFLRLIRVQHATFCILATGVPDAKNEQFSRIFAQVAPFLVQVEGWLGVELRAKWKSFSFLGSLGASENFSGYGFVERGYAILI